MESWSCACKTHGYLKTIVNNLVITCDKTIDMSETIDIVSINLNAGKETFKTDYFVLLNFY